MIFQEPQAEFVPIILNDVVTSSTSPGYETCNGKPAASNNCLSDSVFWLNNLGPQPTPVPCSGTWIPAIDDYDY